MLKKTALLMLLLGAAFLVLMLTSRSAGFVQEDTLEIGNSAATVWSVLSEVQDWPRWWPGMKSASIEGELHEGTRIDISLTGDPGNQSARLTTLIPGLELGWERGGVLGSVTRTRLRLIPSGNWTVVAIESHVLGPQAILARYTRRDDFALYHEAVLKSLKMRLDSTGERP